MVRKLAALAALVVVFGGVARAEEPAEPSTKAPASKSTDSSEKEDEAPPDKRDYTLLRPTPDAFLRDFNTDRPDKADSPYTIDAGHVQIELGILSYIDDYDPAGDTRRRVLSFGDWNVRIGLLNNLDVQLIFAPYVVELIEDRTGGHVRRREGQGDFVLRLDFNLIGNDGGPIALALIPLVKFPTARHEFGNNRVEGGISIPVNFVLPAGFNINLTAEFDAARDEDDTRDSYHLNTAFAASLGKDLGYGLSVYVELAATVSTEGKCPYTVTVDTGVLYKVLDNLQVDLGVNIGVNDDADDLNPFLGLTFRY